MKLTKIAFEIGNGAAVYVPKEYSGREIVIILPEETEELKSRVLTRLIRFMPNILGVYLYGSYARGEQKNDSDIDLLVIVKEKDKKIKEILKDIDLRVVTIEGIKKSIKDYPGLIMPLLEESKVLLNPILLEELKNSRVDYKKFKWNFDETERTIKIIEKFIEIDDKNISSLHIYSLIMRIRGLYSLSCLFKKQKFSNKGVENLFLNNGFKKENISNFFSIYKAVKENKELMIKKEEILPLIKFTRNYLNKIKNEQKKKT